MRSAGQYFYYYVVDGQKRYDPNQPETICICPQTQEEVIVNTVYFLPKMVTTTIGKILIKPISFRDYY